MIDLGLNDDLQCIGETHWIADPTVEGRIIGRWAEDGSTYAIMCPPQLRYAIVKLQNILVMRLGELEDAREEYIAASDLVNLFLGGRE